jgi:tetratricopeptide (TPR) repeat protein
MDLRPWKLWNADGSAAEGTAEIVSTLESVLKRNPKHVGANHYYIHAVEASPAPRRALPSAQRLAGLAPDAGHLVHMPAHILMRTGDYRGAAVANERAAEVDRAYIARRGPHGVYPMMYYNHNLDFLAAARAMEGRYADAKKAADMLYASVSEVITQMPEMAPMVEPFLTRPAGILLRFDKWDELLALPQPPASRVVDTTFWHYGRAMAFAAKGDVAKARSEQQAFVDARKQVPNEAMFGLNGANGVLDVTAALIDARIARASADEAAELAALRKAVTVSDALAYDEPPDFYYPVRESLGGALLRAKEWTEAERIFREDLSRNPDNPRSLFGLSEALRMQQKSSDAEIARKSFDKLWHEADVSLEIGGL